MKNLKTYKEFVNEAVKDFDIDDVLITLDNTKQFDLETDLFKKLGIDYIDSPGAYSDEYKDYSGINDYMQSNMGKDNFNKLYSVIQDAMSKKSDIIINFMKKYAKASHIKKVK